MDYRDKTPRPDAGKTNRMDRGVATTESKEGRAGMPASGRDEFVSWIGEEPKAKASRSRAPLLIIAASAFVLVASIALLVFSGGPGGAMSGLVSDGSSIQVEQADGAGQEGGSADGRQAEADDAEGDRSSSSASATESREDEGDSRKDASEAQPSNSEDGDTSSSNAAGGTAGGSSSSGSSSGGAVSGGSSSDGSVPSRPSEVTISFGIDSSSVGSPVSYTCQLTLPSGATALDALAACGIGYSSVGSAMGAYVSAIGGLAEKQYGPTSGWMYLVNGSRPSKAASSFVLSDGDSLVWSYVA